MLALPLHSWPSNLNKNNNLYTFQIGGGILFSLQRSVWIGLSKSARLALLLPEVVIRSAVPQVVAAGLDDEQARVGVFVLNGEGEIG